MCFINESDWFAELCETESAPAEKVFTCDECYRRIAVGTVRHTIHQQQYECCYACTEGECSCPRDKYGDCIDGCSCEEPEYGETFDYEICHECHLFLKAVEIAELAVGCAPHHTQPSLLGMVEEISAGGSEEAVKYFETAENVSPELLTSGYLNFLWQKLFYEDWTTSDE